MANASGDPIAKRHGGAATLLSVALAVMAASAAAGQDDTIFASSFDVVGARGAYTLDGILDGDATNPMRTTPVTTRATGSTFISWQGGYTNNNSVPTDNKGNTFVAAHAPVAYNGYGGQFDFKLYKSENGHGGSGHVVSIVKNGTGNGEIVTGLIEVTGASSISHTQFDYPASGSLHTSSAVTVTGSATLVALWTGDSPLTSTVVSVNDGFTPLGNYTNWPSGTSVQTAIASKEVGPGTYHVSWNVSPSQGGMLFLLVLDHDG